MKSSKPRKNSKVLKAFEAERLENRKNERLVKMTIQTRVPSKWRFHDLETGDVWRWDNVRNGFVPVE
jgi:hypothetical protein